MQCSKMGYVLSVSKWHLVGLSAAVGEEEREQAKAVSEFKQML